MRSRTGSPPTDSTPGGGSIGRAWGGTAGPATISLVHTIAMTTTPRLRRARIVTASLRALMSNLLSAGPFQDGSDSLAMFLRAGDQDPVPIDCEQLVVWSGSPKAWQPGLD